ncbi:MAG: hypothetical protein WA958_02360 [Tunicatimonas sp.]
MKYWFIPIVLLLSLGCRDDTSEQNIPSPDPIKFTVTANSGGCSNFQVYHYSDDRTYGLLLVGDSAQLGLSTSWQTYALDQSDLSLTLYEFRQPLDSYFCDDGIEAGEDPLQTWDAEEGSIQLRIAGPGQVPGVYTINVVLEDVLVNEQRLERIARDGIEVGRVPG